jgi:NADPH:quinone reductase-like Zn-dependent oxidoreductase
MKAAVFHNYGKPEVVKIEEVNKPIIKPNQVLIRVYASSVNSGDARLRRADPWLVRLMYGLITPKHKILGVVFAGIIEEAGNDVTKYKIGQRVYGMNDKFLGSHAQYVAIGQDNAMGLMPDNMSYVDAAALPFGATTALHFLANYDLKDKTILLNGASGSVGVNIIQLAALQGALVTAVTSTKNIELVKSLGATDVIDYTVTNLDSVNNEYDFVIDCVNNIGMDKIEKFVKRGGVIIFLAGIIKEMLFKGRIKKAKAIVGTANPTIMQYDIISELYSKGKIKPVISITLPLEKIVEAHQLVDSWRKVGTVVITID